MLPRYERRRDQPLVDPAFFRSVPFTGAVVAAVTTTGRQVGNSLGVAVLGSVVTAHARGPIRAGFTEASHIGWWVLAGCGALIAALGIWTTTGRATATTTRIRARFPAEPAPPTAPTARAVAAPR
ncbi:MAG: EmrB/QacA subfamily drug resistance transporter [Actinoallomurus sp.]|nr:EmrB/QacA subfamily drug resistance transporter [Actinoallomurus sp.]